MQYIIMLTGNKVTISYTADNLFIMFTILHCVVEVVELKNTAFNVFTATYKECMQHNLLTQQHVDTLNV